MKHGMFQRSISLLLALVMILGNMPVNAWATETEETPAPACAHSYEAVTTAEATCTEAGTVVYTCSCGDTYTETVAATGHSYAAETTAATCTEAGTVVYTCGCGDTYTDTIPATGEHAWGEWAVTAEATYEAAGLETRACGCGATEDREIPQLVAAHEHAWGEWTVAAEATYEAAGLETRACECGETENREIHQLVQEPSDEIDTELFATVQKVVELIDALPTEIIAQKQAENVEEALEWLDETVESDAFPAEIYQLLDWEKIVAVGDALDAWYGLDHTPAVYATVKDPANAVVGDTYAVKGSAEAPVAPVVGTFWTDRQKSEEVTCGLVEHTHVDDCYKKDLNCSHTSHDANCYSDEVKVSGLAALACVANRCGKHAYHFYAGSTLYGANTLTCQHVHVPYGQEGSCYIKGDLGSDCPTVNLLDWDGYEHTHSEPACYTYTWTLAWNQYDVTVSFEGNDIGIVASEVPATAQHGADVTFKLSATNDSANTWTAKIGDKAYVLSATEATEVTAEAITSGDIKVILSQEEVKTYGAVVTEEGKFDGCSAELTATENLLPGAKITVQVTMPQDETWADYSYTLSVSGEGAVLEGDTVTVGNADVTVTVTYSVRKLILHSGKTVYVNKSLSVDPMTGLKEKLLSAIVDGYAGDAENYKVVVHGLGNYNLDETLGTVAKLALQTLLRGEGASVTITDENGLYQKVEFALADARKVLTVTTENLTITGKTEPANVADQVKAKITIQAVDPQTGDKTDVAVDDSYISYDPKYAWPEDGEKAVFTVTVSVVPLGNETYQPSESKTLELTCVDTTVFYKVEYLNGYTDDDNLVAEYSIAEGLTTEKPADPTREYYNFAGWTPAVEANVMGDATYTATWTPVLDNNHNDIADQEETYTVEYDFNGGKDADGNEKKTHNNIAWGATTPAAPANNTFAREDFFFSGWGEVAETVTAPTQGNTITYTAQWDALCTVIFDGVEMDQKVTKNEQIQEPETPVKEKHMFLGWAVKGTTDAVTFPYTVTDSVEFVSLWAEDFNNNGEDDADEIHVDIVYMDGETVLKEFENVLVGLETPTIETPAKDGYKFNGWDPEVAELVAAPALSTADGYVIVYTAQWLDDVNGNNVPDAEETIQVTIVGNGSVNGKTETFTAVYDSVKEEKYALNIAPAMENGVSKSYVSSVQICGEEQTLTYNADYSVALAADKEKNEVLVTFADAAFAYDEDGQMRFYVGMEDPDYEALYNAVITAPAYDATEGVVEAKYLARPAATYQMQVPVLFEYNILSYKIKIGGDVVDVDLDDAWLDVGESFKTLTPEELQAQYDTEIQKIKDKIAAIDLTDISWSNALDKVKQFTAISEELTTLINTIKNESQYLGYHQFGESGLVDENGNVQERVQIVYKNEAMCLTDEDVYVTLVDDRIATNITGGDLTFEYDEFTDADIFSALSLVDANGNAIDGKLTKTVDLAGTKVGTRTYTVSYGGSWDYKPATATFTLTVIKAPSSTDIVNQTVTYGSAYSAAPVITNKHGKTIDLDAVEFFLGLDVADLDVDGDGVKGLEGRMQLILTKELQTILSMVGLEEGAELNISDLINALTNTGLLEQWGISSEMVDALKGVLDSINGVVETNNLMITIGGNYPTDIGAYLHGAVTVDANYETSFDVGYLIIKPDAQRAYLNWNYTDSNGIFTQQLLTSENLGASAYDDAAFTVLNETATAQVQNLFLGFDENGEVVLELFAQNSDPNAIAQALGNGGYTQLAFVAEFGNELYYAVPIARAFAIIPGVTKLDIILDGQPSADLYKTVFDNAPVDVTVNGQIPEDSQVKLHYYGIEANTHTYESDIAPTHTGAYAITATLLARDGETGELTTVGLDVATVVIQPTESSVTMKELQTVVFDGENHNVADTMEITASSTVENLEPDTTVITASIATDGSFSENGWAAVKGTVNVDFPRWMDELISKYAPSVKNGITLSQLENRLLNKLPVIAEKMEELGATNEMVNSAKNLLNNVAALLEEMPADATLSFKDNYEVLAVGTYAVAAVVTDSDHIPSVAAGLMVIVPDADQVFLDWDYHDENNIWSRELLSNVSINATAFNDKAFTEPNEQATGKITYQFIGLDQNAGLKIYTDPAQLPNGIYTQIAYIELEVDSQIILSDIIARTIMIVPNMPELQIVDVNGAAQNKFEFTFDNEPVELYVNQNGTRIENEIRYIGLQTNGVEYDRTVAPVHAGVYTAITVVKTQENVGMDVALVTIAPAKSTISVTGGTVPYNGKEQTATVKAESPNSTVTSPDYILISGTVDISAGVQNIGLESLHGDVNIDLPKWLDDVLAKTDFNRVDADVASLANAISAYRDDLMNLIPEQVLEQIAMSNETLADIIKKVNSGIDELLKVLEKLPDDVHLTFENNKGYSELGSYFYYGIVADSDHIPAADTGLLVIEPAAITSVEVASEYVYNGQAQTAAVVVKAGDVELSEDCYTISGNVATDAGKYTLTVTGTGNYSGTVTVEWTIAKAAATVTVDNKTAIYGEAIPEFTATIVGVFAGDTLEITYTCENNGELGTYPVTAVVAEHKNYDVTVISGTLTIKEKVEDDQKTGFQIIIEEPELVDKIVEIDGIEYQLVDGKLIISEDTAKQWMAEGTKLMTAYAYKEDASDVHKEYPTAMYVWVLTYDTKSVDNAVVINEVRAVRIKELDNYMMYEGTSIRINFVNDAIRFFTSVTPGGYSGLKNGTLLNNTGTALDGAKMLEMGTRAKKFNAEDRNLTIAYGTGDIVFGAGANADGQATDGLRKYGDGTRYVTKEACYLFTGAMENLPTSKKNLNLEFVVRPYVTLQLQNGQTTTLYGGKYQRTISYVAYQNQSFMVGTAYNAYIQNIINISGVDRTTGKIS